MDFSTLDKSKVYLAFNAGTAWYSKVIELFSFSTYSHVAILHYDPNWQAWLKLGAEENGVCYTTPSPAETKLVIAPPVDLWVGLRKNIETLGSYYAYPGLLGMAYVEFQWHLFKKKVHNPWLTKKSWFCSEIATRILYDSGLDLGLEPGSTDPEMLQQALRKVVGVEVFEA